MMTEKNIAKKMWLEKEFRSAENDVRLWPEWMRREGKTGKLPPMKKFILASGTLKKLLQGKTAAMLYRFNKKERDVIENELVLGNFPEKNLRIVLEIDEDPIVKPFKELTEKEAQECGYMNQPHAALKTRLATNDKIAIIKFRIIEIDKTPVIRSLS